MWGNYGSDRLSCSVTLLRMSVLLTVRHSIDAGLVNSAHYSSTCVYGVPYGLHDDGRRPGIEAGSRLVHEDYGRIGDELHDDHKPLPLLSGEAVHSRETHK